MLSVNTPPAFTYVSLHLCEQCKSKGKTPYWGTAAEMSVDESVHLRVGIEIYFHWAQWYVIPAVERKKKTYPYWISLWGILVLSIHKK